MHLGDADLHQRVLAGAYAQRLDLGLGPLVLLLDPVGVDAAVEDERLQRDPADLATDRVEAAQQDRLRSVIDDHVHTGDRLERADVAALAADDATFHVVAGQVQNRDYRLGRLLGRDPLNGQRHDPAAALLALLSGLRLDVADEDGRLPLGLLLDEPDQLGLGLGRGEPGDALEGEPALLLDVSQLGLLACDVGLDPGQLVVAGLDPPGLLVEPDAALLQSALALGETLAAQFELGAHGAHALLGVRTCRRDGCPGRVAGLRLRPRRAGRRLG